jgi:plastocyanin
MTTHDESPITRTTTRRLAIGIAIIVILMGIGLGIIIPFWKVMYKNPPPASLIHPEAPPEEGSGIQTSIGTIEGVTKPKPAQTPASPSGNATTAGGAAPGGPSAASGPPGTPLTILQGASVQGSPDYDPDSLTVKKGDKITVTNKDTVPHTVTSGTGPQDPTTGKLFDTSIIEGGASADIATTNVDAGSHPYHCTVHPYMTGTLVVQ